MNDLCADKKKPLNASITIRTNFEGPLILFLTLASFFKKRGSGTLVAISSVFVKES